LLKLLDNFHSSYPPPSIPRTLAISESSPPCIAIIINGIHEFPVIMDIIIIMFMSIPNGLELLGVVPPGGTIELD
jgi:hypothetical protein